MKFESILRFFRDLALGTLGAYLDRDKGEQATKEAIDDVAEKAHEAVDRVEQKLEGAVDQIADSVEDFVRDRLPK